MISTPPVCVRCNRPVEKNAGSYELFEKMHWLCFHLEFEHQGDTDSPCADPSCPWWHIEVFRRRLSELGVAPDEVLKDAADERWGSR
jgi:hypothetical protein